MSSQSLFLVVSIVSYVLPLAATLLILHFVPRPRNLFLRAGLAVLMAWIATILYTVFVYNHAGIAAGHALGTHFPEAEFDNNTVAVALLGGWMLPVVVAGVYVIVLRLCRAQPSVAADRPQAARR